MMTGEPMSLLPHTWSLCVEEHFYLLCPAVVAWLPKRWPLRVMAGVMTVSYTHLTLPTKA